MNAARRITKSLVAALLPLIAVPMLTQVSIAHADSAPADTAPADTAMDACIQAFVASSLEKERPVTVRKVEPVAGPVAARAKESTIYLTAVTRHSGKRLAKATCVADNNGVVLTMNVKPAMTEALAQSQASLVTP